MRQRTLHRAWRQRESTVCFLSQLCAGVALLPVAQRVGHVTLLTPHLPGPPALHVVAWPVVAASVVLAATAFLHFLDTRIVWVLLFLGALAGAAATASIGAAIDREIYIAPSPLLGVLVGLLFGAASIFPRRQLCEARRIAAAATSDVHVVNSCAWVVGVAALAAPFALSTEALYAPVAVGMVATAVGALAGTRWMLRRRWLRRVLHGTVDGFSLEAPTPGVARWLPVLDVLEADADERVLMERVPSSGSPYRAPDGRQACARLVPDFFP